MAINLNSIIYPIKNHGELHNSLKSEKIYRLIKSANVFDFVCSLETTNKLRNIIKNSILITSVGRKTFKHLMTSGSKIKIIELQENKFAFRERDRSIFVNLNITPYYIAQDESGDKFFQQGSIGEAVLHECLHALHFLQPSKEYQRWSSNGLFPEMDDKEEQVTICGMPDTQAEPLLLCENAYLAEQKKPYRINHRSILLPENDTITDADFAYFGAIKSLRESLKKAPHLIDAPGNIHDKREKTLEGKKLTPLSAAVFAGRKEVMHLLLSCGADPLAPDDMGGALFAAIAAKRFDLFSELLSHMNCQVNSHLTNPQGQTLLAEFCLATLSFSDTWCSKFTAAACFLKIMDPKEKAVSQVIKHKGSGWLFKALAAPGEEREVDENGNTIIMRAIIEGDVRFFKELMAVCSFDLEVENLQNETALRLALKHNDEISSEMISILRQHGVKIPSDLEVQVDALLDKEYHWKYEIVF
jgi:ankyrin repeat protein